MKKPIVLPLIIALCTLLSGCIVDDGYHHSLSNLQIQMIAIGGAIGVGLFLGLSARSGLLHTLPLPAAVGRLAQISYSVFLVHFPLSLLVNAAVTGFFPANPVINAIGMIAALALSIAGGEQFYRRVESRNLPTRTRLLFPAGVVAGGWLAALAATNLGG